MVFETLKSSLLRASVVFVVSTTVLSQSPHSEPLRGERYKRESQIAATALKSGNMTAFRAAVANLYEQFPNNSRWLRNLAAAEARLGNRHDAVGHLRVYASMGLTLEANQPSLAQLAELRNDVPDLKKNAEPVTRSSFVFPAPASDLVIEDIAYDSLTKSFFLSSVRRREIFRCDLKGACVEFVKSSSQLPLGAVLALHADRHHGVLWATTAEINAAIDFRAQDEGASSVLKFDLNSGRLLKRYSPTDRRKHALGDMTVASNGDAFVSDGLSGDVFFISHKDDQLTALASVGVFVSPQTPVLSADEKLLYIPDYVGGIAVLRLSDRHIDWVACTRPAALEGIDGMYRYKDTLIAIQNGTMPERIVSFHLATPTKIDRFDILEGNWQGLGDPTHGIVIGNQLYFIANSGWDRVADDGRLTDGNAAQVLKRGLH